MRVVTTSQLARNVVTDGQNGKGHTKKVTLSQSDAPSAIQEIGDKSMGCSEAWQARAKEQEWHIFVKAICKAATTKPPCPKFPKGCKKCLDEAGSTNVEKLPC